MHLNMHTCINFDIHVNWAPLVSIDFSMSHRLYDTVLLIYSNVCWKKPTNEQDLKENKLVVY